MEGEAVVRIVTLKRRAAVPLNTFWYQAPFAHSPEIVDVRSSLNAYKTRGNGFRLGEIELQSEGGRHA